MKYNLMVATMGVCFITHMHAIDITNLSRGVVKITYRPPKDELRPETTKEEATGTAWFFCTKRHVLTSSKFIKNVPVTDTNWIGIDFEQEVMSGQPLLKESIPVKLNMLIPTPLEEPLVLLELGREFTNAQVLRLRSIDLTNNTPAFSLAYPRNRLRYAQGTFLGMASWNFETLHVLRAPVYELFDGNDRLVLDEGSLGAPIFDKEGSVIGVHCFIFVHELRAFDAALRDLQLPRSATRVTTPWGEPNISGVDLETLKLYTLTSKN